MPIRTIITISHIIGTVLGAGGATFAEIFYIKSMRDGQVDPTESSFLKTTYRVIRIGLIILILSGLAYFILFRIEGRTTVLYSERMWAKIILTLIILGNAILLQARKIPFWLGSAISLTSWYAALVLGVWRSMQVPPATMIVVYGAAIMGIALILHIIRASLVPSALKAKVY